MRALSSGKHSSYGIEQRTSSVNLLHIGDILVDCPRLVYCVVFYNSLKNYNCRNGHNAHHVIFCCDPVVSSQVVK